VRLSDSPPIQTTQLRLLHSCSRSRCSSTVVLLLLVVVVVIEVVVVVVVHNYVVQCALPINLFNEKIFPFVWFWYVGLALISFINFFTWLFRALYWPGQLQYVRKQLRAFDSTQREPGTLAKFTEKYLRRDGMFIVRLIGMNMGEILAGEVLCGVWNNYSPERRLIAEKTDRKQLGANVDPAERWPTHGGLV